MKKTESIYDVLYREWKKEKELRPNQDKYSYFKKSITNLLKMTDYRQKIEEMDLTQFKYLHDTKTDKYYQYSEFAQTEDSQSYIPVLERTDKIEGVNAVYVIPDEKTVAELYVTCLRGEDKGIDVVELDELTDLFKAVEPCSPKENKIPDFLPRWGKEVVRLLLKNGKKKHQDILLSINELPPSYTHITKIFKTPNAKEFLDNEIQNDGTYYSLREPSKFK